MLKYLRLGNNWKQSEWPDQVNVYHYITPNVTRKYVPEPVQCHNCINYVVDPNPIDPNWPMMCALTGMDMVGPYSFCSWGERKGDR